LIKAQFWTSNIEARPPNNGMKCSDGARRWPDGGEVRADAKRSSKAEGFFPKEIWL
jgi:hypothetical protein